MALPFLSFIFRPRPQPDPTPQPTSLALDVSRKRSSRFASLPRELRDMIYTSYCDQHVCAHDTAAHEIFNGAQHGNDGREGDELASRYGCISLSADAALLAVSRQLRHEYLPIHRAGLARQCAGLRRAYIELVRGRRISDAERPGAAGGVVEMRQFAGWHVVRPGDHAQERRYNRAGEVRHEHQQLFIFVSAEIEMPFVGGGGGVSTARLRMHNGWCWAWKYDLESESGDGGKGEDDSEDSDDDGDGDTTSRKELLLYGCAAIGEFVEAFAALCTWSERFLAEVKEVDEARERVHEVQRLARAGLREARLARDGGKARREPERRQRQWQQYDQGRERSGRGGVPMARIVRDMNVVWSQLDAFTRTDRHAAYLAARGR